MQDSVRTRSLTGMALLVALNCISAYIIIPLPFTESPLALQTLVVNLVGFLLPTKKAGTVMAVYILLGLIGIPVFTGGTAGFGKMFGPTGGYIWGFLVAAVLISYFKGKQYHFKRYGAVSIGIGIPVIYIMGAVQLQAVTHMSWIHVVAIGVLPFIPLDIVKCLAAAGIAGAVKRRMTVS